MVGFGNNLLPRVEGTISPGRTGYSQIANSHINTCYSGMGFGSGVCYFHLKRNEQVELLLGLVIPEFRGSDLSTFLNESDMLAVSRVRHNHAARQRQDREALIALEAIVFLILVGQCGGDVFGRLVQPLVAFPGPCRLAVFRIFLDLCLQRFIGGSNLPGNATSHLGREMKTGTNFVIGSILQSDSVTHIALLKSIPAHIIECVTIGQLRCSQCRELFWRGRQFELCRYHRFHTSSYTKYSTACQERKTGERTNV